MAVALSNVSNGSIVQIPLATGGTVDAVKVAYNHYSKSEAVLILQKDIGGANFPEYTYYSMTEVYELGAGDSYCRGAKSLFADTIQGALIEVPIPTVSKVPEAPSTAMDNTIDAILSSISFSYKTINRSIFYPSARELGISTASYYYTYDTYYSSSNECYTMIVVPNNSGKMFAYMSSSNSADGCGKRAKAHMTRDPAVQLFSVRRNTWYNWYDTPEPLTTTTVRHTNGAGSMDNGSGLSFNANHNYPISPSKEMPIGKGMVICLSGSIMVNSSSGGAITESSAVESYRKINGKWYRTT